MELVEQVAPRKGRNVVIAIDGVYSKYAYQWYLDNVRLNDDQVFLVHAVDKNETLALQQFSNPYSFDPDLLASTLTKEKERVTDSLQQYANLLAETGVNGTVRSVHTKTPGEGIIKAAKELDADLIITGSQGLGLLRRTLIGSCMDYVLTHSPVPVVIARQ